MKMGDDKPFECTVSGCGMKFTNEDHLTVHKTKHQLTLTLLPNEFKNGQTPGFVDQTPTPSKFLKNFEEVTLFHDFAKNPFEEAFKKATEQQSPCNDLESTTTTSPSIYDTLNTPNPGFLVAVVDNKLMDNTSHLSQHHQNSFVHSSEHSFYLLHSPTCPGTEPTNHGTEWSSMDVEHFNHHHHHHQQQQHVETNQSTTSSNNNNVDNLVYVANGALQQGMVDLNGVSGDSGCITYILANETLVALPAITINNDPPTTVVDDVIVANRGVLGNRVGQAPPVREDGRHLIKICPSPSSAASSSSRAGKAPGQMASAKNGIARTTKDKLKAAIQQNVQQQQQQQQQHQQQQQLLATSNNYMPDFIHQQHGISPVTSSASSSSSSSWNMSYAVSNAEVGEIEECEDVMGSLLTSKKICLVPIEEETDDKRKKFLERNRAAAARCRQKKKVWMNSLAVKSEQLEVSNRGMQSELKQLRKEVQMLRSLLESHKECPVTLKQRALKEEMQSDHVTSSSNSSGSGVGIVITTSDEELAMSALSNMANYAAG